MPFLKGEYMFKTEMHCHTADVSECARMDVDTLVRRYIEEGYSSVVLTNHFAVFTYNYLKCDNWQDWINKYIYGYEKLKQAAKDKLNIILGAEVRFNGDPNDYLLYGLSESFLREHEFIFNMTLSSFRPIAEGAGVLIVQAHPFRDNMRIVDPKLLDGVEIHNGSIGGYYAHDSRNDMARAWANKFPLIKTSGTDLHYPNDKINSGIRTKEKIESAAQLACVLKSGEYEIIEE